MLLCTAAHRNEALCGKRAYQQEAHDNFLGLLEPLPSGGTDIGKLVSLNRKGQFAPCLGLVDPKDESNLHNGSLLGPHALTQRVFSSSESGA